ncbi:Uncharacterised protein [Mycobacteroides abscessus subsp. abscessus]|nr:Uncharacterised protein [Mycobacteroides abscessus subsp. abscessus]
MFLPGCFKAAIAVKAGLEADLDEQGEQPRILAQQRI